MNCRDCIYGDISNELREIRQGNITITQKGTNNVFCTCNNVRNITITNGDMKCSNYEERK